MFMFLSLNVVNVHVLCIRDLAVAGCETAMEMELPLDIVQLLDDNTILETGSVDDSKPALSCGPISKDDDGNRCQFGTVVSAVEPVLEDSGDRTYSCGLCLHVARTESLVLAHVRKYHGKAKPCPVCGQICSSLYELELHLPSHAEHVPHVCSNCERGFLRESSLRKHNCPKQPVSCQHCGRSYFVKAQLKRHIQSTHKNEPPQKRYCHRCEFSCWSGPSLNEHLRTHAAKKALTCPHCTFEFSKLSPLLSHMRIHRDESSFSCPYCGSVFAKFTSLKIHMAIHKDREIFQCPSCEFATHSKCNLRGHKFRAHQKRKHRCRECPYETPSGHRYRIHMLSHDSNKAHRCSSCDYSSRYSWDLKRHMTTRHKRELAYSCPLCNFKATSAQRLQKHAILHRENGLPPPDFFS